MNGHPWSGRAQAEVTLQVSRATLETCSVTGLTLQTAIAAVWSATGAMSARSSPGNCTVSVSDVVVCRTRKGRSSPFLVTVVIDALDEGATWYPCGSIRLQPAPLAAWSAVVTTKSDRT